MIFVDTVNGQGGRKFLRVKFKNNLILQHAIQNVSGAIWYGPEAFWAVPYDNLPEFEDKMGDFLVIWINEDNPNKGGIDELSFPDQPVVPGYSFKTKPYEFQVRGFNAMVMRRTLILADDAGLGKSLQVATAMEALKQQGQVHRGLVVAKASLLYNWRDEIHKHTNCKAVVLDGQPKIRHKKYSSLAQSDEWTFVIMSYETFRDDVNVMQWLDNMKKLDFCVLDEAHKIKNPQSGLGDSIHYIPFTHRYVLTATPLINSPLEAFNYLKFLKITEMNWFEFRAKYAVMGGHMGKEIVAYQNIKELKELIQSCMLRRLKRDKLKELPDMTPRHLKVVMNPAQKKLYDAVVYEVMEDLKDTSLEKIETALAKLTRLQQITNSPALIGDTKTKSAKLDALDDLLSDLIEKAGQKVIVFSRFRTMINMLTDRYKAYNPALVTGDVSSQGKGVINAERKLRKNVAGFTAMDQSDRQKLIDDATASERQKAVYKFQADPSCKLFLGTAGACREGLTLTAATHVVFLDCEWSPAYVEQAWSRAHRIGQKSAVTVHYLICEDTIDEHVQVILERKDMMAQSMIDDGIETVGAIRAKEMIRTMIGQAA